MQSHLFKFIISIVLVRNSFNDFFKNIAFSFNFFTMLPFLPFALEVLPKTGFFPIPSNLLQVGNFNFLWIKFGSKRKQGLRQSFQTKKGRQGKCAGNKKMPCLLVPLPSCLAWIHKGQQGMLKIFLTWILGGTLQAQKSPFSDEAHDFKSKTQKGLLLWPRFLTADVVWKQNVTKGN